jgi:hypothetical protein
MMGVAQQPTTAAESRATTQIFRQCYVTWLWYRPLYFLPRSWSNPQMAFVVKFRWYAKPS